MSGELLERAEAAMARGDLFSAYDAATAAIESGSDAPRFKYIQVLALARMGDLQQAQERYEKYGLAASEIVDIAALGARLLKDAAWSRSPRDANALLAASEAYGAVYARTGDTFPGVNAATLALLGGAENKARAIASEILAKLDMPNGYYAHATKAEALLVCARADEAAREIAISCTQAGADFGARATTLRQFASLAQHLSLPQDMRTTLLAPLKPPCVSMFCGHIMPGAELTAEIALAQAVDEAIEAESVRIAYGALASGADIILAEQLLKRGAELNIVLPFHQDDFIQQSVLPAGEPWIARFNACLESAQTVTMATDMPYMDDPAQFTYGSLICMGLARLRAQHLSADVVQIAVWDGVDAEKDAKAGTAVDVSNWRRAKGRVRVVLPTWQRLKRPRSSDSSTESKREAENGDDVTREMRAIIFTDFRGFTKLQEPVLPLFWRQVMRRMMEVLDRHAGAICFRNTWGDALYSVVVDTRHAATITLDLQDALMDVDYAALGIDVEPHMRVGAHYGPVFRTKEGGSGALNYYGTQVSRTARIEPVTPPGAVYVTEQFAAALAMEAPDEFVCRYVGPVHLAKGYGALRMYLLKRQAG